MVFQPILCLLELPILNHADLERQIFEALLRLSGAELIFVRGFMRKTQAALASDIGLGSHSMISQWESKNPDGTGMDPATENAVRMLIANHIDQLPGYAMKRSLEVMRQNLVETGSRGSECCLGSAFALFEITKSCTFRKRSAIHPVTHKSVRIRPLNH